MGHLQDEDRAQDRDTDQRQLTPRPLVRWRQLTPAPAPAFARRLPPTPTATSTAAALLSVARGADGGTPGGVRTPSTVWVRAPALLVFGLERSSAAPADDIRSSRGLHAGGASACGEQLRPRPAAAARCWLSCLLLRGARRGDGRGVCGQALACVRAASGVWVCGLVREGAERGPVLTT